MTGSSSLSTYAKVKDKYGVTVESWAEQVSPGQFKCKICLPTKVLSFLKGKGALTQHSESEKHRRQSTATSNNNSKQPSLVDVLNTQKTDEIKEKARDLENALVMMLSVHGIQHTLVDCLEEILKKYITDSEIIKRMQLGRTKAGYIVKHGLGEHFEKETISLLKDCHCFAASLDESEVNKSSALEVVVNIASEDQETTSRHFTCLDIPKTDAETIVDEFLESFVTEGIDYKSKLVNVGTDGCSVMMGCKTGVQTRLKEEVPDLHVTGQCSAHNLSNALQYAVEGFDPDIKPVCVDVYQDLGGAKGQGLKRKKEFEILCNSIGHIALPFKKFVNVRFRTIRGCHEPILGNYEAMVKYYSSIKKPKGRQEHLKSFFVDRQDMSKLKLYFVYAASEDLTAAIDFFEQRKVNVHNCSEKLEKILLAQMRKVIDESELMTLDREEKVIRKSREELINLDVDNSKLLSDKKIFIGSETEKFIKELGLSPTSKQLTWFYDAVKRYHKVAVKRLQKYFATALQSSVVDNLTGLGPTKQTQRGTKRKLKSLANSYPKVVNNIQIDSMDKLRREIDEYVEDEDVKQIDKSSGYECYWKEVASLKDGGWSRYEILPSFANAMSTLYISNSEVERWFSLMNVVHQNKSRNCISQETLNSILHIKSGVENKQIRKDCEKCTSDSDLGHCHCSQMDISGAIRESCRKAYSKYKASLSEAAQEREALSDVLKKRKEEFLKDETERREKMKEKLSRRPVFYKPELMQSVYANNNDKKRKASLGTEKASASQKPLDKQKRVQAVNNNK